MSEVSDKIENAKAALQNKDFEHALYLLEEVSGLKLNKKQRFDVMLHKGITKMSLNRYEESRKDLQEALAIGEKNEDRYEQTRALHQLGIITKLLGDYHGATELLREELRRCSSLIPSYYSDLSYNFFEQGDVKMLSGEYEDAEMYFHHAYTFASTEGNYHGVALALQALAHLKLKLGDVEQARSYLQQSYDNFALANSQNEMNIIENELRQLG